MFTEPPIFENGEIKEIPSVSDLDFGVRKLSVSPTLHEGDYLRADESSMGMVTGDVSCTDFLLSDFESMSFDVHSDGFIDIFKSDAFNSCDTDLVDSISIPEPSIQINDEAKILGEIDETHQLTQPLIVYTSSRRRSTRNKSNTGIDFSRTLKNCRETTRKNSIVDLSSLQISRRRRSAFPKRARSFVWGSESNILPDEKHRGLDLNFGKGKRPSRRKSVQRIRITDQDSVKSGKSCAPIGPISLKIRIGSQRYDVGNVNGSLDSPEKSISRALTSTDKEVPGNRGSDAGTSPDSEVINSVPDVPAFEDILPLQEFPTGNKARVSSGDESSLPDLKSNSCKKKDKLHQLGHSSLESKLTEAKSNIPEDLSHCPRSTCTETVFETSQDLHIAQNTIELKSQECETLLPCSRQKIPKHSVVKKDSKSRSKSIGLQMKNDNASKRKGAENSLSGKDQVKEEDANGAIKALASYLVPGHQSSTDVGEAAALSKDLSGGVVNSLQSATSGEMDHTVPVRNAWVLCDVCQKWRRIPATLADQIEETKLGWTCKDNMDKDFADCSIPQEKSNSEINEELEISDGDDAGDTILTSEQNRLNAGQMSLWSAIKSNLFLQRNRKKQTIDEVMVCHCKPPSDGRMGCRSKCLNRILNIECVKGTCPCGERCSNQQFQKRKYARLQYFKCGKKGYGLQALEKISEGQFLIEYVGEVLDMHAYGERQKEYAFNGHKHFYFMTLNGSEVIDACAKGNLGRFINHSCDPNCRTEKWMVNGEVCVGLFALRDIKEGEEVTFDYNYVRVFGAAAKRCVCGSPSCRGYIGGDPKNSEIIVQGDSDDEFPEPVMICEDSEIKPDFGDATLDSLNNREKEISREPEKGYGMKNEVKAVGHLGTIPEALSLKTLTERVEGVSSACADGHRKTSIAINMIVDKLGMDDSIGKQSPVIALGRSGIQPVTASSLDGAELGACMAQSNSLQSHMQPSSHSTAHELEEITTGVSPSKSLPDATECKMKLKNGGVGRKNELAKSKSLAKSRRPSSIKKGKIKANVVIGKGSPAMDKLNEAANKSKKQPELSTKSQFETVEEKLNDWLEPGGGISKRKDASRGYLQLLFLTAASGGHGESIRELSMILDALLKTRSRTVLVDIINKNGLQMLHNILKRCFKVFNKTPVLRKLLKVLEHLATREILTLEHITGGPPRPGVESFKDSILALSKHDDKQVHQSARNFRDRWILKYLKKNNRMERDDGRSGSHARSGYSASPIPHDKWSDRNGKPSETAAAGAPSPIETSVPDHPVSNGVTNEKQPRKRKSRWDVPENNQHSRLKTESPHNNGKQKIDDDNDDDAPPGFSTPIKNPSVDSPTTINHLERNTGMKNPSDFVWGYSQQRFVSRMSLSYGIPSSVLKVEEISVGVQFHPFPPLPQYACNTKCDPLVSESNEKRVAGSDNCMSGKKHARTWSVDPANDEPDCKRVGFQNLGRTFRQQKPSHSKLAPPWVRMRQG